jgi:hypothetical protein
MDNNLICCILITIFFLDVNIGINNIFGHNFSTDDDSSFLTLINKILIENRLLNNSLTIDTNNSGYAESIAHTKNIERILSDILISEDSFSVDSDQFYNNTIIALVVANLADEVLRSYGHAFGIPSNVMLSMNFSKVSNLQNMSSNKDNMSTAHSSHLPNKVNETIMIDRDSYDNAIQISNRMSELYDDELEGFLSNSTNVIHAMSRLANALIDLNDYLEAKESPYKIMENIHGEIHPNLQIAFNLTLKR